MKKEFSAGDSFVCECSADYCDTVERHGSFNSHQILEYTSSQNDSRFLKTVLDMAEKPMGKKPNFYDLSFITSLTPHSRKCTMFIKNVLEFNGFDVTTQPRNQSCTTNILRYITTKAS